MREKDYSNIVSIRTEVYEITEVEKGFIFKNTEEEYRLIEKRTEHYKDGKLISCEAHKTNYQGIKVIENEQTTFLPNGESIKTKKTINALSYQTISEDITSFDKFGYPYSRELHDYTERPCRVRVWSFKNTYNSYNKLIKRRKYENAQLVDEETYEYNHWNDCIKVFVQSFRDGVMWQEYTVRFDTMGHNDLLYKTRTTTTRTNYGSVYSPNWNERTDADRMTYNKHGDVVSCELHSSGSIFYESHHELKYDHMNNCIEDMVYITRPSSAPNVKPERTKQLNKHYITYKR